MKEREIFAGALEREPGSARDAYLAEACSGNDALRANVERLLVAHMAGGPSMLDEPLAPATSGGMHDRGTRGGGVPGESAGDRLGRYKLLQQIGEGGFGTVWMAEQREPVRRKVALKIIKAGMDTKQVIARFEAERQALAIMDHTNIAKVLDGGATDRGRPYFVMELVRGVPITDYCDAEKLDTIARLRLFQDVCHAVQHAHQKGVIHRDLKPSNVLVIQVDGRPVPKVIDFGIAKATSAELTQRTLFTEFHQFIGTPEYMAPEQAANSGIDIDTRADVYSLGVLLYELLTGTKPFDLRAALGRGWEEMLRVIREEEPPRPSTRVSKLGAEGTRIGVGRDATPRALGRLFRDDLDWIVLRALEKERDRRYESAAGLALDIERFLTDEAVTATPPSRIYRLRKAYRRNRKTFVSAGLLLAALVAGMIGTSLALGRAIRAERLAQDRLVETIESQLQAALARDEAEAVVGFLSGMLAAADPAVVGREVRVREVLDLAAARIEAEFRDRPLVEARLRDTLANTYQALGMPTEAEEQIKRAKTLREREQGGDAPEALRTGMLDAVIQGQLGRLERAEQLFDGLLARQVTVLGEAAPDTLITRIRRAEVWTDLGRWQQADEELRAVLEEAEKQLGPDDRRTHDARVRLARVLCHESLFGAAEPLFRRTLEVQRRTLGAGHPDTLATAHELGTLLLQEERYVDAEAILAEVVREETRVFGAEHPRTLTARADLAQTLDGLQRFDQARTEIEAVLELRRRVSGPQHPDTLLAGAVLGLVFRDQGDLEQAIPRLEEALAAQRAARGLEHPRAVILLFELAETYQRQDRMTRSLELMEEGLPIARRVLGPDHRWTLKGLWTLGGNYRRLGRFAEAEQVLTDLLERRRRVFGEDSPAFVHALGNLCVLRLQEGKTNEAEELALRTLEAWRRVGGDDDVRPHEWERVLGVMLRDQGRYDEAELYFAAAIEGLARVSGPESNGVLQSQTGLGRLRELRGDDAGAAELWQQVFHVSARVLGVLHSDTVAVATRLCDLYLRLEKPDAARAVSERILAAEPDGPKEHNELAWYLLVCQPEVLQDPPRAVRLAREAMELTQRKDPHVLDTLAAALFRAGETAEAVAMQRRALELAPQGSVERYEQRLKKYEEALRGK